MTAVTIGWSEFATNRHKPGTGFSYSLHPSKDVVSLVSKAWDHRQPGFGETDLSRKVVVPLNASEAWLYCPKMKLTADLPIKCRVTTRQEGEDPFVEIYIEAGDAYNHGWRPKVADKVEIVCYSAEALLENGGTRTTDCDWEIVAILCSSGEQEPMHPLTMARNFLEQPGGTKTEYTAREFAESIYYHSNQGVKVLNTTESET